MDVRCDVNVLVVLPNAVLTNPRFPLGLGEGLY